MPQLQSCRVGSPRPAASLFFTLAFAFSTLTAPAQTAFAQHYKVIHNFTNVGTDGATPYGGVILDRKGSLYGATYLGGTFGSGSIYKMSPHGNSWKYTSMYSLHGLLDGAGPAFGTLANHNGALFGTTEGGGYAGTAFQVGPCPSVCNEAVMHRFGHGNDGNEPVGGVVFDENGNLYGTTLLGGDTNNGTVFEINSSGVESVIYSFAGGLDAASPPSGVTLDTAGNIYGTSSFGGAYNNGAIYKLTRSGSGWTESVLYNFQGLDDGANPVGGLVFDKSGNIYGGTFDGGVNGGGIVYELSPSSEGWNFSVLYSFTGGYGGIYNKLTFDGKGNLYGVLNGESANGLGSVFKLTPGTSGWTYTDLYDFSGGANGAIPYCRIAVDAHGNIFGTAVVGGTSNQGVVFEITP